MLLARGARQVIAVDVGHGQLHKSLRDHPRVIAIEDMDIRKFDTGQLPEPPNFVTVDVSFISLRLVLPAALALVRQPAWFVALIKPQFEAGRAYQEGLGARSGGPCAGVR